MKGISRGHVLHASDYKFQSLRLRWHQAWMLEASIPNFTSNTGPVSHVESA